MKSPLVAAAAAGAAAVFSLGAAYGASTTTIGACANDATGHLRVIRDGAACLQGESPLSWNQQGPAGPAGPKGDPGPQGPAGPQGPSGVGQPVQGYRALQTLGTVPAGAQEHLIAVPCPTGTVAVGGGYSPFGTNTGVEVVASVPTYSIALGSGGDRAIGWNARVSNPTTKDVQVFVRVICVDG